MQESLRPNKNESAREFKLFESTRGFIRVHKSLRPNESESGRKFDLCESERESVRLLESLRPNENKSGHEFTPGRICVRYPPWFTLFESA